MINEHNIPTVFQSPDIVYHYCDLNTAIEYILHEKQIRLSSRRNSIDPIENTKPFISYLQTANFSNEIKALANHLKIRDLTLDKEANAKQLCLCMNDETKYNPNTSPAYPYEYYGFLKQRMWDQYADKYKGICLAFSLSALKENACDCISGKINYINYRQFELNHQSINLNEIERMGPDAYWENVSKRIEKNMFQKHLDYKDENECRFLSFSNKEFEYINIEKCLKGIIITNSINEFKLEAINKYAHNYRAPVVYVNWESTGLKLNTKEELDKLQSSIEKMFLNQSKKKLKMVDRSENFFE